MRLKRQASRVRQNQTTASASLSHTRDHSGLLTPRTPEWIKMRRLRRRFQSHYDYMTFQVTNHWPISLSAIGVALGAATIIPNTVAIALSIVAFIAGIAAFLYDVRELRRRWSDVDFSPILDPFPDAISPPPSYPDAIHLRIPGAGRGTALVSDVIDVTMITYDLPTEFDPEKPYRLPRALEAIKSYVVSEARKESLIYNEDAVGMRGDPLPPRSHNAPPITLHVTSYYDFLGSNEVCRWFIRYRDSGDGFDPRFRFLTGRKGHLRTLTQSSLADVIGVSTVAITSDGEIVLVKQSKLNEASRRLWAPSGSGSLARRDVSESGTGTLQDIVRRGMERELCEETGIRLDEIIDTNVIGFARWLDRGAKPEFFGVTQLSVTANDMKGRRPPRSDEKLFNKETKTEWVDLSALRCEIANGAELHAAPSLPEEIRNFGSVPLLLALRAMAIWRVNAALHTN